MKLYSESENYKLYHGSMLDMLEVIEKNSIGAIITDPPYELNFMGKGWDRTGIAFQAETWRKCCEVLKPGGYLLAFGGSRTFHRIACAIEDAGFEIRDTIMWLYGSGFPKSLNIGLAIDKAMGIESKVIGKKKGSGSTGMNDRGNQQFVARNQYDDGTYDDKVPTSAIGKMFNGWGTALKPAYEPIIVARKPFDGSCTDNVIEWGVGGLNIDECRVGDLGGVKKTAIIPDSASKTTNFGCNGKIEQLNAGRFPANVILTYDNSDFYEVCGGMPETSSTATEYNTDLSSQDNVVHFNTNWKSGIHFGDSGNACRYFYNAKASKKDRDEGMNMFNVHPTVKPTELMQYLIRLVTPAGATILDCFNGSGSTGKAVMFENNERGKKYKFIGIELTEEYLPIAKARIEYAEQYYDIAEEIKDGDSKAVQLSLFEEAL